MEFPSFVKEKMELLFPIPFDFRTHWELEIFNPIIENIEKIRIAFFIYQTLIFIKIILMIFKNNK